MKVFTNENNTATLKIIIASAISGKPVEILKTNFEGGIFNGPRQLPLLEVNEELSFFSSNAATQYLFPDEEGLLNEQSQQLQEWEATRLQPSVASLLSAKAAPADLRQAVQAQLQYLDGILQKSQYLVGAKLSAVDVILWCTLYPLLHSEELKTAYLSDRGGVVRWAKQVSSVEAVQRGVQQWGGGVGAAFAATSALGIPQNPGLGSPAGTPDEGKVEGPSAEELELAKDSWLNGHKKVPKRDTPSKPALPLPGRRNVLITSALPYVNNVPHLGNVIGCVLSADIFARYCRLSGYNTLYVCGTDEYGTATETKALEEGISPRELCDKYHAIHRDAYDWFDIEFDYFGRTTTPQQTEISQRLFLKLRDNGFISSQAVDQLLCETCDRFLADRFVEGTCPHPGCGYGDCRGDQCDGCGKLVVATELRDPRCKQCGASPVVRQSQQLFLELPMLEGSLRSWLQGSWTGWSGSARGVARGWLREPLRARAVTRDLKWGVPVPVPGYTDKVFYVWFDAPIGYMSITQNATGDYEKWWKPDKGTDVTLYQFMAKDNVPFHAVMFPATLLGVNEGHLLVSHIYATEYLNYEDGKFSKSRGVGVFADNCRDSGIVADVWRYYLAATRPETNDYSYSWAELLTRNNSELLNNLGNFCHRSLTFCKSAFNGRVPEMIFTEREYELVALVNREYKAYVENMERGKLRESLRNVMSISRLGNQLMQATQPWSLMKGSEEDRLAAATCVGLCCNVVYLLSVLLAPYTPAAAASLRGQLGLGDWPVGILPESPCLLQYLRPGHTLGAPSPLFSRLEPEAIDALRAKYGGNQAANNTEKASQKSPRQPAGGSTVAELEKAVADQGEKVRKLKASTKDKSVWQPEVAILLELKKKLTDAQARSSSGGSGAANSVAELEKAVADQGEKVRKLKASTKDKSVWQPEVTILLELKKKLSEAQASCGGSGGSQAASPSVAELEKAVAEQGEKVRKLKASTKDKSVWQPEVAILLELKKKLSEAK